MKVRQNKGIIEVSAKEMCVLRRAGESGDWPLFPGEEPGEYWLPDNDDVRREPREWPLSAMGKLLNTMGIAQRIVNTGDLSDYPAGSERSDEQNFRAMCNEAIELMFKDLAPHAVLSNRDLKGLLEG